VGVEYLKGDKLKVVWAKFSTLRLVVLISENVNAYAANSRVENSKQVLSCKLKFVCDHGHNFGWILSIASVHAGQDEDKM
jgi:hypothetical protein